MMLLLLALVSPLAMFDGPVDTTNKEIPDSSYHAKRGDHAVACFYYPKDGSIRQATALTYSFAYEEYWKALDIKDYAGTDELEKRGLAIDLPLRTPVLVLEIEEFAVKDPRPDCAIVRVMGGPHEGKKLWTNVSYVVRFIPNPNYGKGLKKDPPLDARKQAALKALLSGNKPDDEQSSPASVIAQNGRSSALTLVPDPDFVATVGARCKITGNVSGFPTEKDLQGHLQDTMGASEDEIADAFAKYHAVDLDRNTEVLIKSLGIVKLKTKRATYGLPGAEVKILRGPKQGQTLWVTREEVGFLVAPSQLEFQPRDGWSPDPNFKPAIGREVHLASQILKEDVDPAVPTDHKFGKAWVAATEADFIGYQNVCEKGDVYEIAVAGDKYRIFDVRVGTRARLNAFRKVRLVHDGKPFDARAAVVTMLEGPLKGKEVLAVDRDLCRLLAEPGPPRAATLLKSAQNLDKLGKGSAALKFYGQILEEYPDTRESQAAKEAAERIKALDKG
jgi:hypothetical protein